MFLPSDKKWSLLSAYGQIWFALKWYRCGFSASEDKVSELKENLRDRDEKLETSKIREGALEISLTGLYIT